MQRSLNEIRILLVDDDECLREIMQENLEIRGAIVEVACSGNAAFEKYLESKQGYSLILSDLRMADGTGIELAKKVKSFNELNHKNCTFVIYSGFNDLTPDCCANAGISAHLKKPMQMAELVQSLLAELPKAA